MRLGKLGLQFMLKSQRAFRRLNFADAIPAMASEWYPLKKGRDDEARRTYRDVRVRSALRQHASRRRLPRLQCNIDSAGITASKWEFKGSD